MKDEMVTSLLLAIIVISGCTTPQRETTETGGALEEWKDKIQKDTGPDSPESNALNDCDEAMSQKADECSQHEGWSVINAMEITDFDTDEPYSFQDVLEGGCPRKSPCGKEYPVHVERETMDHQSGGGSDYQIVCNILCVWWTCEETDTTTAAEKSETWAGQFATDRFVCGDSTEGYSGELTGNFMATFTVPRSLVDALEKELGNIDQWETSGSWEGSESVAQQCLSYGNPSKEYEAVEGSVSGVPIEVAARQYQGVIYLQAKSGTEGVLFPGQWRGIGDRISVGSGGSISSIQLELTSISDSTMTGEFDLNPGTGTFTLTKQG